MKKCKQCGKEFTPLKSDHCYCSPRCRTAYRIDEQREKRRLKAGPKICEYCNKEFHPEHLRAKYCSTKCRASASKDRRLQRWAQVKRVCKGCGEMFSPKSKGQVYCSGDCRNSVLSHKTRETSCLKRKPIDPYFLRRGSTTTQSRGLSSFLAGGEL